MAPRKLTKAQAHALLRLAAVGAVSAETGVVVGMGDWRDVSNGAASRLVDLDLADKKVRGSRGGSRCMHYWLTEAGIILVVSH